ncbi:MAG TPA: TolC family protein [Rhodocyclaceae bacterium]|nr:TolC family protein [Rhodocyclaceae bacterium]
MSDVWAQPVEQNSIEVPPPLMRDTAPSAFDGAADSGAVQGNSLQSPPQLSTALPANADVHVRRLASMVRQILERSPELMQAEAESRQTDSQLSEAKANRWPTLAVTGNAGRETQRYGASSRTLEFNAQRQLQTRIAMPIVDLENEATIRQRESKVVVADWALTDVRDRVVLRAVDAYAEILRATQLMELARDNLKTHRAYVAQMKEIARTDIGRASDLPVAAARVSLAESVLTSRLSRLEAARVQWSVLSGLASPQFGRDGFNVPMPMLPSTLDAAVAHAQENSPQLRQAQANMDVAQKQIDIAKSAWYPKLNAETRMTSGNDYGGIAGGQSDRYYGLGVEWRLGASTHYANNTAVESLMAATHARDSMVLKIRGDVTTQWYDALAAVASMKSFDDYVSSAGQVVSAYKDQFKIGRRSLLDVLNAENELFTARSNATTARVDAAVAAWHLLSLQGSLRQELGL